MSQPPNVHSTINPNYQPLGSRSYGNADNTGGVVSQKLTKRAKLDGSQGDTAQNAISNILGDAIITPVMSRNLDLQQGYPHATTGIPYAIQGSATLINVDVSEYLASFQDPIKAILGTSIHREAKVIVSRKYVVGGRALITPEHAPARTVSIQEDSRETIMTRYGGDIEMNLNLFLRPSDAKEELALKVGAQRRELERTLVEHGYAVLMEEGTNLTDAILRSNPAYSTATNVTRERIVQAAERINISSVFGALSKHSYPIQNLLAAAKYASAYTTTNDKGTVLLLPHGSPDILRNTRRENMVYNISGPALLARNQGKPIEMTYDNAYTDPSTNVKILIHRPFPTFEGGVANPDVGMGGLTDIATFANFYRMQRSDNDEEWYTYAVNWHDRCWNRFRAPALSVSNWKVFDGMDKIAANSKLVDAVTTMATTVNTVINRGNALDPAKMDPRLGKFLGVADANINTHAKLSTALIKDAFVRFTKQFNDIVTKSETDSRFPLLHEFYSSAEHGFMKEYTDAAHGADGASIKQAIDDDKAYMKAFEKYAGQDWNTAAVPGAKAICDEVTFRKSAASHAYFERITPAKWQTELTEIMVYAIDLIVSDACGVIQKSELIPYPNLQTNDSANGALIKMASRALYMVLTNSMKTTIRSSLGLLNGPSAGDLAIKWAKAGNSWAFVGLGKNQYDTVATALAADDKFEFGGESNENTIGIKVIAQDSDDIYPLTNKDGINSLKNDAMEPLLLRLRCDAVMSSAILAAPGSETGELLIGYPFTSISKLSAANQPRAFGVCMCSRQQMHLFLTLRVCTHRYQLDGDCQDSAPRLPRRRK